MSLPHFFLEEQVLANETTSSFTLQLSSDDLKHAKVLRLCPGEHIAIVDADNDYFECEIVEFADSKINASITQRLEAPARPRVILFQGLAKGDKMDSIIRQVTELGIAGVVPLLCSRSIVKLDAKKTKTRLNRWKSIAKSAAMQSGRTDIPEISEPQTVKNTVSLLRNVDAVLIFWEEAPLEATLAQAIEKSLSKISSDLENVSIAVIIGPEGGLTAEEVSMMLNSNDCAHIVSLGPSILRTETAGVLAPALTLYELERR